MKKESERVWLTFQLSSFVRRMKMILILIPFAFVSVVISAVGSEIDSHSQLSFLQNDAVGPQSLMVPLTLIQAAASKGAGISLPLLIMIWMLASPISSCLISITALTTSHCISESFFFSSSFLVLIFCVKNCNNQFIHTLWAIKHEMPHFCSSPFLHSSPFKIVWPTYEP